ncbi:MAG: protein phosphatase 2C domain-containing protein [Actinomycetaceae bacterium]|nr:protein phosphatase 2C domain-containing protein [Actinomycetaceae bacterium]
MPVDFRYAARSDVGLRRQNNQDSGYAGSHLLVLCDGMGGPAGGDIASSIAVAHLVGLDTDDHPADLMLHLLRKALVSAHDELVDRSRVDPQLHGLGTTCIALMRSGNKLALVHIGDSRAYVLRDGELTQVTTDHSFVQYLVETGQISPEEAETHPQRSVVLRILGDSDNDVNPDESLREAVLGDRWLLCSDGLSGVVSPETILETLVTVDDPGQCAEDLVQLALRAGGPDNITVVIADVVDAQTTSPQPPQIVGAAAVDRSQPSRGGSGAAAKAAALTQVVEQDDSEDDEDDRPRRSWMLPIFATVLWLALMAAGWLGYSWSQQQYYAQINDNHLVIYQGIPQDLWFLKLSQPVEVTSVDVDALQPVERERLQEPVRRGSREEIDRYVDLLREKQLKQGESEAESSPSPSLPPTSQPTPRLQDSPSPRLNYPSETDGSR